ncbi:uncharacterized protein L3040_007944 [Drepanopeziza brunnea f. sp. 'multigermtubi']|uniref:uncharacterized protein n=1 Tax=Drepanopeziza brunnea f. sp. 'multigermtubi' TaxID=698441 RepID=UPI00238635F4|nr:hypothetical protein L3040_007944 [Drepanopeziza brunnea f. sp. 'multigermtubi']
MYSTEIRAVEIQSKCSRLAMAMKWITSFMVAEVTLSGTANLKRRFGIVWDAMCFSFIPMRYCFYSETAEPLSRRQRPLLLRY